MKFTDIFIKRPVLALVVSLLILLIGLKAMLGLQIRQYPRLFNTTITVTTVYPGASPDLIQGFITTPIEQAVATAEGIDYLTSNSIQGTSTVTAYIRLNYDPSQALTDVMAKVQQVKYLMPAQAQDPIILKSTGQTTAVMYVGFASAELYDPATGSWMMTTPMSISRSADSAVLLTNGQVLVAGGGTTLTELYNPEVNRMGAPREEHTATALPNGNVLVTGGNASGLAEQYDASSGNWLPLPLRSIP